MEEELTSLEPISGQQLTTAQINGITQQIDLDITNLLRDGKLAAVKYSLPGGTGPSTDRAANLHALLAARDLYQKLLDQQPAWKTTAAELDDIH